MDGILDNQTLGDDSQGSEALSTDVLESLDPRELGQELARARKKSGLTQEDAARVIEAARTTVTAIEKGDRRVRPGELIKLARAYGRSVGGFVRLRPPVEPFRDRVQFRGPFARTVQEDEKVAPFIDRFEDLCRDYLELERITDSPFKRRYPPEVPLPKLHLVQAAESLAQEERNRLGLGDAPVHLLRDVLEQEVGLRIFFLAMPAKFSEMYVCDDRLGGCVAINSGHPEERRRWSMAHAYAHFLSNRYKPIVSLEGRFRTESDSERFAEAFTAPFLMPTGGLRRRVAEIREASGDKLPIADVLRVAHRFGVSPQALVRRLEDLRELPSGVWEQMRQRVPIRESQERLGLGPIPGREDPLPVRYRQLAFQAFDDGLISEGRLAQFLRVDHLEARLLHQELRQPQRAGDVHDGAHEPQVRQVPTR